MQTEHSEPELGSEHLARIAALEHGTAPRVRRAEGNRRRRGACRPSFGHVVWFIATVLTGLWIADRFTTQFTPRQGFSIGRGKAAGDRTEIKEGPLSVAFYDLFARFSGRFLTLAVDVLYLTKMRSSLHALAESPCVNRYMDMSHAFESMQRMHNIWGIATGVFTLLHVWSILFPLGDGYSIEVKSGTFEWPLSERKPKGFKDISGPEERHIMLQVDDVWRLFLMTVLFGWLAPLSYKWFKTKYHVGIHLHNFVAIMYVIDIVRRHTHPHNWFMNPPIVFLWLIDVRALKARGLKPATCSDPAPAPALPQNVTPPCSAWLRPSLRPC